MQESDFDDLDRRVAHALAVDGRAPFSAIAEAVGASERTVARRYGRLRSTGAVRVVAGPAVTTAAAEWFLRVRCAPTVVLAVARALARREDTTWVSVASGGTEIVCSVRADHDAESEALLLDTLPRTPRVEGVTAHSVLHTFYGGPDNPVAAFGPLDPGAVARLRPPAPAPTTAPVPLGERDRVLAAELADDGRASLERLARATGWSPSTVGRRLAELRATGALYLDLDVAPELFGRRVRTLLWISVPPAHLAAVGEALAAHPEIAYAAATTGPAGICATALCRDRRELYAYLTGPVAALPGVTRLETAPVIRSVKQAGPVPPV